MAKRIRKHRTPEDQAAWRFERQRRANLMAPPGPSELVFVLDGLRADYNIGKIFRSADAFGVREIHLVGVKVFDPSSAGGSFKWVPAKFHDDVGPCLAELDARGYEIFVMDPKEGSELGSFRLPSRTALLLGNEYTGPSFEWRSRPGVKGLKIPQIGKVESLNVSVAASVAAWEYFRQARFAV